MPYLLPVSVDRLPDVMERVLPHLSAMSARSGGKHEPSDLIRYLVESAVMMWIVAEDQEVLAVALTEVAVYPRRKVCHILGCVGEGAAEWWPILVEGIEAWARGAGCASVEPVARPGWERVLKAAGYRKTHVLLEKELT